MSFILRNQQSLKTFFFPLFFVFIQAMKNQLSNVDEVQTSREARKKRAFINLIFFFFFLDDDDDDETERSISSH